MQANAYSSYSLSTHNAYDGTYIQAHTGRKDSAAIQSHPPTELKVFDSNEDVRFCLTCGCEWVYGGCLYKNPIYSYRCIHLAFHYGSGLPLPSVCNTRSIHGRKSFKPIFIHVRTYTKVHMYIHVYIYT